MTEDTTGTAEATSEAPRAKTSAKSVFLKLSGYKEEDLLDYNERNRVFVTTNGGKYVLTKKEEGGIRTLSGPDYPKLTATEE